MRSLLPVCHAGVWMFRQTPASVLNEFGHLLDLALDPSAPRLDAEWAAVKWSMSLRQKLHKFSQARPLQEGDQTTYDVWQDAFMFLEDSSRPGTPGPEVHKSVPQAGAVRKDYCLWHMMYKCTQSRCGRHHGCPICNECNDRPAPLAWHLSQLKKPQKIVPANEPGSASGAHVKEERDRTRSPKREWRSGRRSQNRSGEGARDRR